MNMKMADSKLIDSNKIMNKEQRLPKGQHLVENFPILDLGFQPGFDAKTWKLKVYGEVAKERGFSYKELLSMPKSNLIADFHCVTAWSKYDLKWSGVKFSDFLKIVRPKKEAKFVIFECEDGYTTNIPLDELNKENVILAYNLNDKPIPKEHGWPLRPIIPSLYGWKSAKFVNAIKFTAEDVPGYWEVRGYHNHGNPWKQERYS